MWGTGPVPPNLTTREQRLASRVEALEAAFKEWECDLADGADQRYQSRVHAILKPTGCQSEWLIAPNGTVYPNPETPAH